MKSIILHGSLKELYPHPLEVVAETAAEAISALSQRLKLILGIGGRVQVELPDFQSRDAIYEKTERREIHVYPTMAGAGGGGRPGMLQIVIGVVLIAAAFFTGGATLAAGTSILGMSTASVAMMGAMMVLGGLIQLLAPTPELEKGTSERKSEYLGAPKNTVRIGTPIPLIYGRRKAYGHFLSFDIDAKDSGVIQARPTSIIGRIIYAHHNGGIA